MHVLVLGGTQFIGRHVVENLLAAGHRATILTRGRTPDALPAAVERLRGDRDDGAAGLAALAGRAWDACIDVCGYLPRQVRPSAEMLRGRVGRYVYVSAVSVYGDPAHGPVLETHPRLAPAADDVTEIDARTYGPLKVTCEDVVEARWGDACTLLRPQIVVGPHDPFPRLAEWIRRAARPGPVLAPGDGTDHVQTIDVRDVARFVRTVLEHDLPGTFNLAGPRLTWANFMELLGAHDCAWIPAERLAAAGLTELHDLPLYRRDGGPRSRLMHVSAERALAAGLAWTDPPETIRAVRDWLGDREVPPMLAPEREAELLRGLRSET